ncbi:hypothetical protein BH23PLA1_BH23PLA1_17870 [soil metagenome]
MICNNWIRTGMAGLIALGLSGLARAQTDTPTPRQTEVQDPSRPEAAGTVRPGQPGGIQQDRPDQQAGQAGMRSAGQADQVLIGHALGMAIDGSMLHLAAKHGSAAQQGQAEPREGQDQARQGQEHDPIQMLRQHAQEAYEGSNELFEKAFNNLGGDRAGAGVGGQDRDRDAAGAGAQDRERGAAGVAGQDRQRGGQQSMRLYRTANQYRRTLWNLTGDATGRDTQGQGGDNQRASGLDLEKNDLAKLTVINHSVKEAIDAFKLRQIAQNNVGADQGSQALMDHAREMFQHSRQALEQCARGGEGAAARDRQGADRDREQDQERPRGAGGQQGQASVDELANQALAVVEALEQTGRGGQGAGVGAEFGTDRPGSGIRTDRQDTGVDQPGAGTGQPGGRTDRPGGSPERPSGGIETDRPGGNPERP